MPSGTSAPPLQVLVVIQGQGPVTVYGQQLVGAKHGKKIEAFQLNHNIPGLKLEYMAHIEGRGDIPWVENGHLCGSTGSNKRIEGFAVRVIGHLAKKWDVKYYGHIEGAGDSPVASDGKFVGTRGQSRRIEGMCIWLEQKHHCC